MIVKKNAQNRTNKQQQKKKKGAEVLIKGAAKIIRMSNMHCIDEPYAETMLGCFKTELGNHTN